MEEEQDGLELQRYLEVLTRWWWLILVATIMVGGGAFAYSKVSEHTVYKASTTILIQESRGAAAPTFGDIGISRQLAETYKKLLTTRPLLDTVAEQLDRVVTIDQLQDMVDVSTIRDTPLLEIEATSDDPDLSIDVVNTLAQTFKDDRQNRGFAEIAQLQALADAQGVEVGEQLFEAQFSTLGSISIEEPATFAYALVQPPKVRNTVLGAVLGLFLGVLGVFLLEYLSRTIRSPEYIDRTFGLFNMKASAIGIIHRWSKKEVDPEGLVVHRNPGSIYSEMYRQVRTGFQFAAGTNSGMAYLITSAMPREGKTTVAVNLGVALAQGGSRVILVEGDMRRPSFHHVFGLNTEAGVDGQGGLSTLLTDGTSPVETALSDVGVPRLKVLAGGAIPPNPADLLGTDRMIQIIDELRKQCDYLLVDSPPVLSAADPMILAPKMDGIVLVATLGETRSDDFKNAVQQIQQSKTPVLGYVLNKLSRRGFGYGRYNYRYYYYYQSKGDGATNDKGESTRSGRARSSSMWRRLRRRLFKTGRGR